VRVLVIAAHPDDEVLGAGGTIARYVREGAFVSILIVTEGCSTQYPGVVEMVERKQREALEAARILGVTDVRFGGLPDMKLDTLPSVAVNACIEQVVREVEPNLVFTQAEHDVNRDHQVIFDATAVACRPFSAPSVERIYSYYTPSSSEWGTAPFQATTYVDVSDSFDLKLAAMSAYASEVRPFPHPRSLEALRNVAGFFGNAMGMRFAEPFRLFREIRR
jgi:LmbE family N-acetylglucosaminyl deacetylase